MIVALYSKKHIINTKDFRIICIDDYLSLEAQNDIYLNIDQNFITFMTQYFDWESHGKSPEKTSRNLPVAPPFSSIHISEMTFRLDYKPKQSTEFFEFVNFVPLRNPKILFRD